MQYVAGLWKAWESLQRHLYLSPENNSIPTQWSLSDLIFALHPFATLDDDPNLGLTCTLEKLEATLTVDLWDVRTNTWRDFEEKMQRLRNIPQWIRDLTFDFLIAISQASNISWDEQLNSDLWVCSDNTPTNGSFLLSNAQLYDLLRKKPIEWTNFNQKWGRMDSETQWKKRWRQLWGIDLTRRLKHFSWQICIVSLFTQEQAQKIGRGDGCCKSCPRIIETPKHIFYHCS